MRTTPLRGDELSRTRCREELDVAVAYVPTVGVGWTIP
jgi:hypothetical protein